MLLFYYFTTYMWLYNYDILFCRYLCTLKGYVQNKAHSKGSITEGYLLEECMHFCSRYLKDTDTTFHSKERNFHGVDEDTYQGFLIFKGEWQIYIKGRVQRA